MTQNLRVASFWISVKEKLAKNHSLLKTKNVLDFWRWNPFTYFWKPFFWYFPFKRTVPCFQKWTFTFTIWPLFLVVILILYWYVHNPHPHTIQVVFVMSLLYFNKINEYPSATIWSQVARAIGIQDTSLDFLTTILDLIPRSEIISSEQWKNTQ